MFLSRDRGKLSIGEMFLKAGNTFNLGLSSSEVMMTSSKNKFCYFANFIISKYWVKAFNTSRRNAKSLPIKLNLLLNNSECELIII